MPLSSNIQKIRKIKKLSVQDLAAEIGVKKQSVYDWENGAYAPSKENLDKLAAALGVEVKVFFDENITSVQDEPAIPEKPLGEAARIYQELYEKFLGTNSEYLVIHKDVLKDHRLVAVEQYAEDDKRLEKDRADMEQRSKDIQALTESLREIATRPININFTDIQRAKE